ncbi:MAG: hypothetical protein P4M08_04600 [Oligoflexia bacterium]|nr:hypothetical protein [Oligoflexia bacterium]
MGLATRAIAVFLLIAMALPAALAHEPCVANALSASLERDTANPNAFLDFHRFEKIYQARRAAGEGEPGITFSSFERARNYVLKFPAFQRLGFNTGDATQWSRVYVRLPKSPFYGKFVGWETKLANGNYARYRYDYDPEKGAHWNIEMSIVNENGRHEDLKLSVQFLCGTGKQCTQAQALAYLKSLN